MSVNVSHYWIRLRSFEDQVVVILHQRPTKDLESGLFRQLPEELHKSLAIDIVPDDRLATVTAENKAT